MSETSPFSSGPEPRDLLSSIPMGDPRGEAAAMIERVDSRSKVQRDRAAAAVYGRVRCSYGSRIEVVESLAARGHLWLRMESSSGVLWYLGEGQAAAHLSPGQAADLRDLLSVGIDEAFGDS